MIDYTKPVAETNRFIVLDKYTRESVVAEGYQSEDALEREFVEDLVNQGYEHRPDLKSPPALLANAREQLQALNAVVFSNAEWARFTETWLDKPSDGIVEKTRKIHDDHIHDFVFDDGRIQNIYLLDAYSGQFDRAIRFYLTGRSGLKMTAPRPPSHHFGIYYCRSFWSTVSASLRRLSPFRLKTIAPPMRRSQMASATVGSGI